MFPWPGKLHFARIKAALTPAHSLTQQTLIKMAIRIAIVVIVATIISYFHVSGSLRAQALEQLRSYIEQRGVRESNIFLWARDNLLTFIEEYEERLNQPVRGDPQARFDKLFVKYSDGSTRLREDLFEAHDITGIIGKNVTIDAELQRRLIIGFDMLAQYGPAWQNRFVNLYITTPENAVLMFWPDQPWALRANSWEVHAKLALTAPKDAPVLIISDIEGEREAAWSDLYFDYAVNNWMVSGAEPINRDGRYLLAVGHDMLLSQLIERTINNRLEGTYNVLFREDGRLLAHPQFMDAIQAQSGALTVHGAGDEHLLRIFELATQSPLSPSGEPAAFIVENDADAEYLAVTQLQGPGWYLVTVFPKAIIAGRAFETARLILFLGAIALLLEIIISFAVLREQIARPLKSLMQATNRVSAGDFDIQLDDRRTDEIGRLADSFNTMSHELKARETALSERNLELSQLNQQLERELEERTRAEQEIDRQREVLHQSEKLNALGSLLAGVAHELNNPLSVVVGRTVMLEEAASDLSTKTKLQKIRQAAERCSRIIKTFLTIARQQTPERSQVQLNTLIEASIELMAYGLRTADIQVKMDLDPNLPALLADADQLTQVFTNLIVNAQHALEEVSPPRLLAITTDWDVATRKVCVAVTDNGPGVPAEIRTRIFDPFYTSKPVGIGTGIGLSYSNGVIQAHGGTLSLEDPPEGGARFLIMLPATTNVAVPDLLVEQESENALSHTVLIVDDELEIAELLSDILEFDGHRVEIAASGNAALRRIAQQDYDLIITDLKMPDLDGPGLYKQLEQTQPHLLERIIFITGDTLGMGASEFLSGCGRPLIDKPFVPNEVRETVRQMLA